MSHSGRGHGWPQDLGLPVPAGTMLRVSCIDTLKAHPGVTRWVLIALFSGRFDLWPIYTK